MHCGKYIELNPVRAGIVNSPDEYQFSSFNYYANGLWDPVITDNPIFLELSNSLGRRRKLYSEFVVDERLINSDKLKKQIFIGNQNFIAKLEKKFHIRNVKIKPGRPRKQEATALPVPSKS